jgi:Mg-chelatase subunit ChlD
MVGGIMNRDRVAKQKFNIILLVDTSRSMQGSRIGQVNQAISDISKYLKDMQIENTNVDFYISILTFATEAKWVSIKKKHILITLNLMRLRHLANLTYT